MKCWICWTIWRSRLQNSKYHVYRNPQYLIENINSGKSIHGGKDLYPCIWERKNGKSLSTIYIILLQERALIFNDCLVDLSSARSKCVETVNAKWHLESVVNALRGLYALGSYSVLFRDLASGYIKERTKTSYNTAQIISKYACQSKLRSRSQSVSKSPNVFR